MHTKNSNKRKKKGELRLSTRSTERARFSFVRGFPRQRKKRTRERGKEIEVNKMLETKDRYGEAKRNKGWLCMRANHASVTNRSVQRGSISMHEIWKKKCPILERKGTNETEKVRLDLCGDKGGGD